MSVQEYKVTKLSHGTTDFRKSGYFYSNFDYFYIPGSIDDFYIDYGPSDEFAFYPDDSDLKFFGEQYTRNYFYCGQKRSLLMFRRTISSKIYVPYEFYEEYCQYTYIDENNELNEFGKKLKEAELLHYANIEYHLCYGDYDYYYIDYYENRQLISRIPSDPTRKGYEFAGWYTDNEYVNKWDFASDFVETTEEKPVVKLYAKWETSK